MSSLGDIVHMLPAIGEATIHVPGLEFDWIVEEQFAAIPAWHSAIRDVIPIAIRRWRKAPWSAKNWQEIRGFTRRLRASTYDLIIDSQGLLKSAFVTQIARGPSAGHDFGTAREGLASLFYDYKHHAHWSQHAIDRKRMLMAKVLGYTMGSSKEFSYGITPPVGVPIDLPEGFVLILHGTARPEKEYPETDWLDLVARLSADGIPLVLPWANQREHQRAERLAAKAASSYVLPLLDLEGIAAVIGRARAVLGVDTGLMHLAAAFRKPGIGLYPATPPERFGVRTEPNAPPIINLSDSTDLLPNHIAAKLHHALALN